MDLTFSDASGLSRFTSFTVLEAENNFSFGYTGKIGDGRKKRFNVRGSYDIYDIYDELDAVAMEYDRFAGEQPQEPYRTVSPTSTQVLCTGRGELVTITADMGACDDLSETGVILVEMNDPGTGPYDVLITITFFPCDYAFVNGASSSAIWLPSEPT